MRISIETQQRGADIPDELYSKEQNIPADSIRRGIFMREMSTDEFLGRVRSHPGVAYSEKRDFRRSVGEQERAFETARQNLLRLPSVR